jgi:hypothetical protein
MLRLSSGLIPGSSGLPVEVGVTARHDEADPAWTRCKGFSFAGVD